MANNEAARCAATVVLSASTTAIDRRFHNTKRRVPQPGVMLLLLAGAGTSLVAVAQAYDSRLGTAVESPSLERSLEELFARPELRGTVVGAHVIHLPSGGMVFQRDIDRLFIPASNMKLVTTAAALLELGPDFEFRTVAGLRDDDLVVVGGGDPAIGGRFTNGDPTVYVRRWANLLRDQGLSRFDDLVIDDSFFDAEFIHPHWPKSDVGHWYAAPVGALVLNDSCVDVRIAPGPRSDTPARVSLVPNTKAFTVDNRARTVASSKAHAPRVHRKLGSKTIRCEGGVFLRAQSTTGWITVDDPGLYFADVLREVFAEQGISFTGKIRREPGAGRSAQFTPRVLHRFPLLPVVAITNKESQNLYAECLLKTVAAQRGTGSWSNGNRVVAGSIASLGLEPKSFVVDDGCGLSRSNRLSPRAITSLLAAMHRGPHRDAFRESLAVAGVDGTLSKRLADDPYRGRVWAKTGSITGVRAISGYAQTRSGEWLAFSFLVNSARHSVRGIQDEFCKLLVDWDARSNLVRRDAAPRN